MANFVINGVKELEQAFGNFIVNSDKVVDDAVRITAFKVKITATTDIREPSNSGRFVTKGTVEHQVSKEGDAPNTDTGRLIGSLQVDHKKGKQIAFVGTNLDYGLFLETTHNRPWLEPAKMKEIKFFADNVTAAMKRAVSEA